MSAVGTTTRVGLIGWPVEHSVSPAMFNAAFDALGLAWRYEAFPVPPDRLAAAVGELVARGVRGVNVTVPHKRAVMSLLDAIHPAARAVGAVNTITVQVGSTVRLHGTNTDVQGFREDLQQWVNPGGERSQRALVLGAGGAARAAVYVLAGMGYQVSVAARDPARGLDLIREVQVGLAAGDAGRDYPTASRMQTRVVPWDRLRELAANVHLIVNCTPVGMWPQADESPWPEGVPIPGGALVYDMVYRPARTTLLRQAESAGAQAVSGLGMLVRQGAAAFRLWTGQEPPLEVMFAAARQALSQERE